MSDKEIEAHNLVRGKEWMNALLIYDQILTPSTNNFKTPKERIIGCLVGRTECNMELKNYDAVITDCRRLLKMLNDTEICSTYFRIRRRLIHSLYKLKRYSEAESVCKEWISAIGCGNSNPDMCRVLERYKAIIQAANGKSLINNLIHVPTITVQHYDAELIPLESKLETWATHNLPQDRYSRITKTFPFNQNSSNKKILQSTAMTSSPSVITATTRPKLINNDSNLLDKTNTLQHQTVSNINGEINELPMTCTFCAISFKDRTELRTHCQTEAHQNVIMSDEGKNLFWFF